MVRVTLEGRAGSAEGSNFAVADGSSALVGAPSSSMGWVEGVSGKAVSGKGSSAGWTARATRGVDGSTRGNDDATDGVDAATGLLDAPAESADVSTDCAEPSVHWKDDSTLSV
jgi:hypothetical protein